MEATAQLLSLVGLLLATLDYSLLIRRRAGVRRQLREASAIQQSGLQGLVRVLLADEP